MDPDPDLTIVLLGNSGVGKSASGNTILGRTLFESKRSFKSVTTQISKQTGTVFGKQISVIDTPGIFGSENVIKSWCQKLLPSSRPCLFLVVIKIDRFTIEQNNAVEAVLKVIGVKDFNKCYLLFTGGDSLDNMTLQDFINEDSEGPLIPLVERFSERLHLFNNQYGGQKQVRELLKKSGHLTEETHSETDNNMNRRLVLLGLTGGGKSSSGNTILPSDEFKPGCDFNAVTTKTVSGSATVEGRQVKVVDTPGFTGKVSSPRKLFEEIMKSVVEASPGPHAFIIVVQIGRVSEAEVKLFRMLRKLFGKDACKYAMVLFTHGDRLDQPIDHLIQRNEHVKKLVSKCGNRYCVFDNTKRGNKVQVKELLDKIDDMVTDNEGKHYTSDMFYKVQNLTVKMAIRWKELKEWFQKRLKVLDACRDGYGVVDSEDDSDGEAAGAAQGDQVPLLLLKKSE